MKQLFTLHADPRWRVHFVWWGQHADAWNGVNKDSKYVKEIAERAAQILQRICTETADFVENQQKAQWSHVNDCIC